MNTTPFPDLSIMSFFVNEDVAMMKKAIRLQIKGKLEKLTQLQIASQSDAVSKKVINHPLFLSAKTVCIYLSMPREIQTWSILKCAFDMNKNVVVPKVIGRNSLDLVLVQVGSLDEINSFPKNSWGIPEPALSSEIDDKVHSGLIDAMIVPGKIGIIVPLRLCSDVFHSQFCLTGVAFDSRCGRVGHGKGYYGECI